MGLSVFKPWGRSRCLRDYFLERVALLAGGLLDFAGEVAAFAPFFVALGLAGLALA